MSTHNIKFFVQKYEKYVSIHHYHVMYSDCADVQVKLAFSVLIMH